MACSRVIVPPSFSLVIDMYFDRFDVCEAWYLFLSNYHWGQGSSFYQRLSKMSEYFSPSPMLRYETLSDNGRVIYDNLVDTKGEAYPITK